MSEAHERCDENLSSTEHGLRPATLTAVFSSQRKQLTEFVLNGVLGQQTYYEF